jgi:hypothetical protein
MKMFTGTFAQDEVTHHRLRVRSKKSVQPGRSFFTRGAYAVCVSTEQWRDRLAAFFNRPIQERSTAKDSAF